MTLAADDSDALPARATHPLRSSVPPVCILLRGSAVLAEVVALAQAMLEDGRLEPVVITTSRQGAEAVRSATTPELRTVWLNGTPHACTPKNGREGLPADDVRRIARHRLKRMLLKVGPLHTPILWRGLGADLHAASELIERVKPVVVAAFSDRTPHPDMALLHTARRSNVPTVLLPFAASTQESDAFARRNAMSLRLDRGPLAPVCRAFAHHNPRHAMDSAHGRMLFFSIWDSLALAGRGLHMTSPWGGRWGRHRHHGRREHGGFRYGALPRTLRRAPAGDRTGFSRFAASVLLPPQRSRTRPQRELWLATRSSNCLVCGSTLGGARLAKLERSRGGHPGPVSGARRERRRRAPVPSPEIGILGLSGIGGPIRAAYRDGAATGHASRGGHVRRRFLQHRAMGSCAGDSTVVFDPARIGYRMYDGLRSVPKLTNATDLGCELSSLAGNSEARARRAAALRTEGQRLGMIDGKACARIIELFAELAGVKRQRGTQEFSQ